MFRPRFRLAALSYGDMGHASPIRSGPSLSKARAGANLVLIYVIMSDIYRF